MEAYDEDTLKDDFICGARVDLRKLDLTSKKESGEMVIKCGRGDHYDEKKGGNLIISFSFLPSE